MKASDYISQYLEQQGVTHVFEVIGGMITHLIDSLHRNDNILIVSMHHEQAAAFAAEAVGRVKGIPGVALATSGPGATNLLTGIGSCFFDSIPAIFITGQVNSDELKGKRNIRQLGFQETDIVSIAAPITKAAWAVRNPEDIPDILDRAFKLATEGRPGPILIDIPMDIQRSEITPHVHGIDYPKDGAKKIINSTNYGELFFQLERAKKPLILVGGGIRSSNAIKLALQFLDKAQVPVVHSLMGVDILPYDNPLRIGMIGSYGNRWANVVVGESDFLLVLGSRLDIRQTGADKEAFQKGRIIFHVDCEEGEVNNRLHGCFPIIADLKDFFAGGIEYTKDKHFKRRNEWLNEILQMKNKWLDTEELSDCSGINPNKFFHELSYKSKSAIAFAIDVGQNQMWAAQSLELEEHQRFLTSGGMGAMGYALPTAIGVALISKPNPVVAIAGDGGFQMNIQELQTIVSRKLPIKMVVINNRCLGMVRQFQEDYFDSCYQSTVWGYDAPTFSKVALGYGIQGETIKTEKEIKKGIEWLWEEPDEPALLEVMVDRYTNLYPKIAFGSPMTKMEPVK